MRAFLLWLILFCAPLAAQPVSLDLPGLRDAGLAPHLDRSGFADRLADLLPVLSVETPRPLPGFAQDDPFFWSLAARFGPGSEESVVPGGVVTCARYGLITRDLMTAGAITGRGTVALMRQALLLSDDVEAWPEGAVARLACALTWDDARRVAAMGQGDVMAALSGFDSLTLHPDPRADSPVRVFGPGGYRILARGGVANSIVTQEAIWVEQLATHHLFRFRSFLMGGGV